MISNMRSTSEFKEHRSSSHVILALLSLAIDIDIDRYIDTR